MHIRHTIRIDELHKPDFENSLPGRNLKSLKNWQSIKPVSEKAPVFQLTTMRFELNIQEDEHGIRNIFTDKNPVAGFGTT